MTRRPIKPEQLGRIYRGGAWQNPIPAEARDDGFTGDALFAVAILSFLPWAALLWIFLS